MGKDSALNSEEFTSESQANEQKPVHDERIVEVIAEFERAGEALQKQQEFVSAVLNTIGALVVVLDPQGRIVRFNSACEKITGYLAGEVLGKHVWDIFVLPEEIGSVKAVFKDLRTGRFPSEHTNYWRTKDGGARLVAWSNTAILGSDRVVEYVLATGIDITEIQRLHEQLIESERLASTGTMAAVLAHEVGNSLNAMYMNVQLLDQRLSLLGEKVEESIKSVLRRLTKEVSELSRLVEDFCSLARREKYNFDPVSLSGLAAEVLEMEKPRHLELGIHVVHDFSDDLPFVMADETRLKQVLLNLCKNAADAMPHGGSLVLRAYQKEGQVVLEIKDTGCGIPKDIDIFEPFVTTKRNSTGLGLFVVRQVLAAHKGTISFTSEPGQETVFRLTLPLAQTVSATPQPAPTGYPV
jgi:PAS domain S-box-containing protein